MDALPLVMARSRIEDVPDAGLLLGALPRGTVDGWVVAAGDRPRVVIAGSRWW